jgi:hypothetical protein
LGKLVRFPLQKLRVLSLTVVQGGLCPRNPALIPI